MEIEVSRQEDIEEIFRLYKCAREFQKTKKTVVVWPEFDRSLVETELHEGRQYKIILDDKIAAVFAITNQDEEIWQEKNRDSAVYIHRIATNPEFRGHNFVKIIADWAIEYALEHQIDFVRLDTLDRNEGLIKVYTDAGFTFLGMFDVKDAHKLPEHYQRGLQVALFEIIVNGRANRI